MSVEITTAFVEQFKGNAIHRVQQKGGRLRQYIREENLTGEAKYFERIGPTAARKRTSRHSDTPRMDTPHDRRKAYIADYDWADLVDNEDKVRLLIDPASEYLIAGTNAMFRAMDDVIIESASATNAYDGDDATVSFPAGQQIAKDYVESGAAADSNLTIGKLRKAADIFGTHDIDPDVSKVIAVSQNQLTAMLKLTEVTSADYNSVKALVDGQVNHFMGFDFVRTQRLQYSATSIRKVLAFIPGAEGGLGLHVPIDINAQISRRADKNYAVQVFLSMTLGGARIEDEKVVWIACDETK